MGFGSNYYPVETPSMSQLENGDYTVCITKAELSNYSNGNEYVSVTVRIKDHPDSYPNKFFLNSAPELGAVTAYGRTIEHKDVDAANAKITRFFKSFGMKDGNFDLRSWIGKVGTVHCDWQYDKNEEDNKSKKFKQLTPVVRKSETTTEPKKEPVEIVKNVTKGTVVKAETKTDYQDDFPF